jgi:signal transduction histidine kinase
MNQVEMTWQDIRVRMLNFMQKARLSDKTKVEIDLDASLENEKLTSFEGVNIYRILQECIHNAVKHADANLIKIQISKPEPDQIQLTIEDDGVGFDLEEADLGNGILNLKKRVSDLKGKFSLHSSPNQGTRIDVILTKIVHD